jgi:MoaA/NifB/PqqE/SkfB family radical SAM enzyme
MRKKYLKLIKNKLKQGRIYWIKNFLKSYALVSISILNSKPYSGPFVGTIIPTYRCNLKCEMCNLWKIKDNRDMTYEEIKDIADSFKEIGTPAISLCGGEPTLRKDLVDIIKYIKNNDMLVHLCTNGTLLTKTYSKKLIESGLDAVSISLDGSLPYIHENIRGMKGSYRSTMRGLRNLTSYNKDGSLEIDVVSVVSEHNVSDLENLIKLVSMFNGVKLGLIPLHNWKRGTIKNKDLLEYAINKIKSLKKKSGLIDNSFEYLDEIKRFLMKKPSAKLCGAGYLTCVVGPDKSVFPCDGYSVRNLSIGSLDGTTLKEFWFSERYEKIRRNLLTCQDCRWNCQFELNEGFKIPLSIKRLLCYKL